MLTSLRIENFALIDKVEIPFGKGFTVITGETGAGKSILLNALNLILGERADFSVIGNKKDKSIVEAEIDISDFNLKPFFKENDLDYFETTIIRREIYKQGRSRAFINDTPIQLSLLKSLTSQIIHIHSQYNTLELKQASYQIYVLDVLADTIADQKHFEQEFFLFQELSKDLKEKKQQIQKDLQQLDYNAFQLKEIDGLDLNNCDYEELEVKLNSYSRIEDIRAALSDLSNEIESDNGVYNRIYHLKNLFQSLADIDDDLAEYTSRLDSLLIEMKDLGESAGGKLLDINVSPGELNILENKLNEFNRILYKHGLNNQQELLEYRDRLINSEQNTENLNKEISELEIRIKEKEKLLYQSAEELHLKRSKAKKRIEEELQKRLEGLKLPHVSFKFSLIKTEGELTRYGITKLEMLFSPNPGVDPLPVHEVASGGELSRVMLTLQSMISSKTKLRTLFFDEIDTGVSGEVAQKMGETLKRMGENMQVIAITHLPQVAAKGEHHLKVEKDVSKEQAQSNVIVLDEDNRIKEIARLMSGDKVTDSAIENAKLLME